MQSNNEMPAMGTSAQGKQLNVLGHAITAMLFHKQTGENYYAFKCVSPPGLGIPYHLNGVGDAIVIIVEGEYSITIGDKRFAATNGDLCFFPKGTPHAFQNVGTKAGTTTWTMVPGENFEQFFESLSKLPAGDPDAAVVAKIFTDSELRQLAMADA